MRFPIAALALSACQVYQFEPVTPVTVAVTSSEPVELRPVLKPNVMLVVDRSASMMDPTVAGCTGPGCATRLSDLKGAVASFTTLVEDRVRLGLTVFPQQSVQPGAIASCQPASGVQVALPAPALADDATASMANRQNAASVNREVQALIATGGTPTGPTLRMLSAQASLNARDFRNDFVVLLTDGLPNCNPDNPNNYEANPAACECQTSSLICTGVDTRRRGCLDADGAETEITRLAQAGIKTIVVGFGTATAVPRAKEVLERMAKAGGVMRRCTSDVECGAGDRCAMFGDMGQCQQLAWQASNQAELELVLRAVLEGLTPLSCTYDLPAQPLNEGTAGITVLIDGKPIATTHWSRVGNTIVLERGFCEGRTGSTLQVVVVSRP